MSVFKCLPLIVVVAVLGCATEKPALRPMAKPNGQGLFVAVPQTTLAPGTTCGDGVMTGLAERFKSAAAGSLSSAGFGVVSNEKAPMTAKLELMVDYCGDGGIVSGSTALTLERTGKGTVWTGQVTGDQARSETAASTMNELVERMLYDERVIGAVGGGQ